MSFDQHVFLLNRQTKSNFTKHWVIVIFINISIHNKVKRIITRLSDTLSYLLYEYTL